MKTALEIAMEKTNHVIPPITDPLGSAWKQPKRSEIEIDAEFATMKRRAFNELCEYSGTFPSGVYVGKMWKRHDGGFDRRFRANGGKPVWKLVWFGFDPDPKFVSNNYRTVRIIEDGSPVQECSCCLEPDPGIVVAQAEPTPEAGA